MALTPSQVVLAAKLRKNGIVNPIYTVLAAAAVKLPITLACALLTQESGGGYNEWGHDPTIFVGGFDRKHNHAYGEVVTQAAYLEYRSQRGSSGQGGMQGVGPCQLTWYAYQDQADKLGGCWKPRWNMQVGFGLLHNLIARNGLRLGVQSYNGTGPAAVRYATQVLTLEKSWAQRLGQKSVQSSTS